MRKMSVRGICPDMSSPVMVVASFSCAARAAMLARSMASGVAATVSGSLPVVGVELVLVDVLHDAVRHEVPDGLAVADARAAVGRGDRHRGHLLEGHLVLREPRLGEVVAGTGDADEVGEVPELVDVLP